MTATALVPSDSANASPPQASATSAVSAFMSEMAVIALPSRSAAWKARKPPKVPIAATTVQPGDERAGAVR